MAEIASFYLYRFLELFGQQAVGRSRADALSGLVTFGAPRAGYESDSSFGYQDRNPRTSFPLWVATYIPYQLRITKSRDPIPIVPQNPTDCTTCHHSPREIFYGPSVVRVCTGSCDSSTGICQEDPLCSAGVTTSACGATAIGAVAFCRTSAHNTIFHNRYIEPEMDNSALCSNSCQYALDGECDDGGYGAEYT